MVVHRHVLTMALYTNGAASEVESDLRNYNCSVTILTRDSWNFGNHKQPPAVSEVIFEAIFETSDLNYICFHVSRASNGLQQLNERRKRIMNPWLCCRFRSAHKSTLIVANPVVWGYTSVNTTARLKAELTEWISLSKERKPGLVDGDVCPPAFLERARRGRGQSKRPSVRSLLPSALATRAPFARFSREKGGPTAVSKVAVHEVCGGYGYGRPSHDYIYKRLPSLLHKMKEEDFQKYLWSSVTEGLEDKYTVAGRNFSDCIMGVTFE